MDLSSPFAVRPRHVFFLLLPGREHHRPAERFPMKGEQRGREGGLGQTGGGRGEGVRQVRAFFFRRRQDVLIEPIEARRKSGHNRDLHVHGHGRSPLSDEQPLWRLSVDSFPLLQFRPLHDNLARGEPVA